VDQDFLASFFAVPPVLLGRKLKPFCCGHAVILASLESPFIVSGKVTPEELIVAVWVCSQTFEEGRDKILNGGDVLRVECEKWGGEIGGFDFSKAVVDFERYLTDYTKAPERWKTKASKEARAPWPLVVATTIMHEFPVSESDAWNMPLPKALWYFAACAEAFYGDESLVSQRDRERAKRARTAREGAKNVG